MRIERITVIRIFIAIIGIIFLLKLYNLQITQGEEYLEASNMRSTAIIKEKAPRGDIKDRNGKTLVTNREGYSLQWIKTAASEEETNEMLLKLIDVLAESSYEFADSLPISRASFEYSFKDEEEKQKWFDGKKRLRSNMSAEEVINFYREMFNFDESLQGEKLRIAVGIRYEAEMNGFSYSTPYTVATDVDIETVMKIKERSAEFPDIEVTRDYFRQYEFASLAAHTLGRIGKIYKEEYAELKDKGYAMNDYVGKQGIEKLCEDYLKGQDGITIPNSVGGEIAGVKQESATAGNYVVLTLDSDLQMAAEESLKKTIENISAAGEGKGAQKGADANAGAAVVLDVNSGEVLSLATYPSYNIETFNESYSELSNREDKPLWNRAISGTYSPGSTFKPLTAMTALETGAVTIDEKLMCDGVYKYFKDYQPKCWIYLDNGLTHGWENVTEAIEDSCNLYFYEAGRRTGIDALKDYAGKFGLGEYTGIELTDESKGNMASPEYKKKVENDENAEWYGGDTIQAAIGQSYSHFTPLQLANYIATLVNGGVRYRPHIVKSIHNSTDGAQLKRTGAVVENTVTMTPENFEAVKRGMYGVVDEGSASKIFKDYKIEIGGKTGTAQGSSKESNTALFVAFAPYDKPEIAVAVVIEHGVRGVNAAGVAKDIFDEYFDIDADITENYGVGELLP